MALCSLKTYGVIALGEAGTQPAEIDYNLRISALQFNLAAGTRFFWDSNFNRNNNGGDDEAAFAVGPTLSIQAYWPISPYLAFSTGTSIGYEYYLEGDANGRDGLIIGGINNETSRFDVDLSLSNDAIITLSNTFSANIASASVQTNNQQRQDQPFRQFTSVSSLRYAQRLTPNSRASFGYSFTDTFTQDVNEETTSNNNSIDSQAHSLFAELGTQINDSLMLSLQSNLSSTEYDEDFRNDFEQYQLGPRVTYVSESGLSTSVYVAINRLEFDNTNNPATQDNESSSLIFESSINFTTGNYLNHALGLSYLQQPSQATTANPGTPGDAIPANFQEETGFTYRLNYLLNDQLNVGLSYGLSLIEESDGGNEYNRETISVEVPFQLNTRTTISTRYSYSRVFGSEFAQFNYDQHRIEMNFQLNF